MLTNNVQHKRKVSIIGTGYVGSTIAYALMLKEIAREIVLIDININTACGEVLDIRHGIPYMGSAVIYNGDYSDCKDSDLIIITAGRNRKPGETRLEMAEDNISILKSVTNKLLKYYTNGVILIVTNPVDVLTYHVTKLMGLPDGKVFGTGCILDCSRFISEIASRLELQPEVIDGMIVGEHGEGQVPIWSKVTVAGIPIEEYCEAVSLSFSKQVKHEIAQRVKKMGANIIDKKQKTHFGIATCTCYLADAILNSRATIASVSSVLHGEYGLKDVSLSVPSIVGKNGVEKRIVEQWSEEEMWQFALSGQKLAAVLI